MIAATNHWLSGAARCTAALVLLAGCLDRRGGQSGTEGSDSSGCIESKLLHPAPEDVLPGFEQPLSEVATRFAVNDLPWVWFATGERTTLSIELATAGATARARSKHAFCGPGLETDVRVWSADGVLDARVRGLFLPQLSQLVVPLPAVPDAAVGPAVWAPDVEHARAWLDQWFQNEYGDPLALYVQYVQEPSELDAEAVLSHERVHPQPVGASTKRDFSAVSGPPFPFTPDPLLASACEGAEQYRKLQATGDQYTSRASAAEALSALVGTWARCLDPSPRSLDGLQILPDGTWRDVTVQGGELVARSGFEHEGFVRVVHASAAGNYQLLFYPFGVAVEGGSPGGWLAGAVSGSWDPALIFRSEVDEWPLAVYRPTLLPVRADAPEYAEGERAGTAGCSRSEYGLFPPVPESESFLRGEFVRCSGALSNGAARLHFDGGQVELQREDGSSIRRMSFEQNPMNAGLSLVLSDENASREGWNVTVSRRPLKLWIEDDLGSAVFSALP